MAFLKRLGFYLIGLSIGLVFLFFFLKKKSDETGVSFCYLPNCRVLKELRSKPFAYSEQIDQMLTDQTLDSLTIDYFMNEGDVNFKKSDTKNTSCKIYLIEGTLEEQLMALTVKNCDSTTVIEKFQLLD